MTHFDLFDFHPIDSAQCPKKVFLYTGTFNKCREVLISDFFRVYKKFVTDVYIDNTLANSQHVDLIQDAKASNDIKKLIEYELTYS